MDPAVQDQRAVLAFDGLASAVAIVDAAGVIVRVNDAWLRFAATFGTERNGHLGANYFEVCRRSAESGDRLAAAALAGLHDVRSGRVDHYSQQYPCRMPDGEERWYRMIVTRAPRDGLLIVAHDDVTTLVAAEQHQRLLSNELNHRVKNTLAVVQAIAAQTVRATRDVDAFKEAFTGRLAALSRVHDLLTRTGWSGEQLKTVAETILEPFGGLDPRVIDIEGPDVMLDTSTAVVAGLALQELATNAVKYGALQKPSGRVSLTWQPSTIEVGHVDVLWIESGGPTVSPPQHEGFGSRLLKGMTRDGHLSMEFLPAGLRCSFSLPVASGHRAAG